MVKSFRNPLDTTGLATKSEVPRPATAIPPAVADDGDKGSTPAFFAMADHTHASKARKGRVQTAADGTLTWVYKGTDGVTAAPFANGVVPRVQAIAETADGVTDVINVQIEGTPTNTQAKLRVTRTQRSVVALIGLTILSIPASPGVTWLHLLATEP